MKYVNTWMHAGAVRVNSEKMSKSLGNFFTIRDVLEKYDAEVVRMFLSSVHYRSYIDYSEESLKEARSKLERFYQALNDVELGEPAEGNDYQQRFDAAMDDDFNTPQAFAVMFELVNELNTAKRDNPEKASALAAQLKQLGGILGLLQQRPADFLQGEAKEGELSNDAIEAMIQQRADAKANKDYAESDRIRDELASQGIILKDSREGTSWYREG